MTDPKSVPALEAEADRRYVAGLRRLLAAVKAHPVRPYDPDEDGDCSDLTLTPNQKGPVDPEGEAQ